MFDLPSLDKKVMGSLVMEFGLVTFNPLSAVKGAVISEVLVVVLILATSADDVEDICSFR